MRMIIRPGAREEIRPKAKWLTTFNDLITLLLVFFVLLFSMSSPDVKKMETAVNSLQSGVGVLYKGKKTSVEVVEDARKSLTEEPRAERPDEERGEIAPETPLEKIPPSEEPLEKPPPEPSEEAVEVADALTADPNIEAVSTIKGVLITLESSILFKTGEARLSKAGESALDSVVAMVKETPHSIRVDGHTDNVPIHTRRFASNWELSIARAVSVVKYFINEGGITPERMSAAGYGDSKPLPRFPNDTPENRRKNRRVEIILEMKGR
ncbi:MAG: OmpA family protein [Desulfobacterales bacterium]|nr:OmpA family protein [Desulfobacterales bacterium]